MSLREAHSPRYKIKQLSKQLRTLSFPTSSISVSLAKFAADAFDSFLTHKCKSLDEAFGIAKGPGAPRKLSVAKEKLVRAKAILSLRTAGKTWAEIEEELGVDQRVLRRDFKPFKIRLISRNIGRALNLPAHNDARKLDQAKASPLSEAERWDAWKKQNDKDWATYLGTRNNLRKPAKKRARAKKST